MPAGKFSLALLHERVDLIGGLHGVRAGRKKNDHVAEGLPLRRLKPL